MKNKVNKESVKEDARMFNAIITGLKSGFVSEKVVMKTLKRTKRKKS